VEGFNEDPKIVAQARVSKLGVSVVFGSKDARKKRPEEKCENMVMARYADASLILRRYSLSPATAGSFSECTYTC